MNDRIPAELFKARWRKIRSEIHKLINSVWNKDELPEECNRSIFLSIRGVIKHTVVITGAYHFCHTYTILYGILL